VKTIRSKAIHKKLFYAAILVYQWQSRNLTWIYFWLLQWTVDQSPFNHCTLLSLWRTIAPYWLIICHSSDLVTLIVFALKFQSVIVIFHVNKH